MQSTVCRQNCEHLRLRSLSKKDKELHLSAKFFLNFEGGYVYNLGIGLSSTPPNFGKVWFPCFDNFVERSTYDYIIITKSDMKAYCVGSFISEEVLAGLERYSTGIFP